MPVNWHEYFLWREREEERPIDQTTMGSQSDRKCSETNFELRDYYELVIIKHTTNTLTKNHTPYYKESYSYNIEIDYQYEFQPCIHHSIDRTQCAKIRLTHSKHATPLPPNSNSGPATKSNLLWTDASRQKSKNCSFQ